MSDIKIFENLCLNYFLLLDFDSAKEICRFLRIRNLFEMCIILGEYFTENLGLDIEILDEVGISYYYSGKHTESFKTYEKIFTLPNIDQNKLKHLLFNQHFSINNISDQFTYYDYEKIQNIPKQNKLNDIIVTITSCKRFDLFQKTLNSFINCNLDLDLIKEWFVIDDNSSPEDISKMKELYPFLTVIQKDITQKGHPKSMNILRNLALTQEEKYIFHMEDDWSFFRKDNYIRKCLDVLKKSSNYGQCLINMNYAELPSDNIAGGFFKVTPLGTRYLEHEYIPESQHKYTNQPNCCYWPHFSFRPSLIKTRVFREVGVFNEQSEHFEMEYARRYIQKGFKSCFLYSISSKHTGRLTSERHNPSKKNAYDLNGESLFVKKNNN
jgi:hypothetical protein